LIIVIILVFARATSTLRFLESTGECLHDLFGFFLGDSSIGRLQCVRDHPRKKLCPGAKVFAERVFELGGMPDVSFQALTADTAPRHSAEEAPLGLTGVVAIDITWGYAL
jgi:hypothetical protein